MRSTFGENPSTRGWLNSNSRSWRKCQRFYRNPLNDVSYMNIILHPIRKLPRQWKKLEFANPYNTFDSEYLQYVWPPKVIFLLRHISTIKITETKYIYTYNYYLLWFARVPIFELPRALQRCDTVMLSLLISKRSNEKIAQLMALLHIKHSPEWFWDETNTLN